jgi:hypothetical protein
LGIDASGDDDSVDDESDDEDQYDIARNEHGMNWRERVDLLDRPVEKDPEDRPIESPGADPYDRYREILDNAEATAWLQSAVKRGLVFGGLITPIMRSIRATVLETLRKTSHGPTQKISHRRNPPTFKAHFQLQWSPLEFFNQELDQSEPPEHILQVITVTGVGDSFQALPCKDYLFQTWPFSASALISLVEGLVKEPYKVHTGMLLLITRNLCILLTAIRVSRWKGWFLA